VPSAGVELEDKVEAADELEEEDEEARVEVVLLLAVLPAPLVYADVEEVHGLVGTAMVTT
jgi:hypothetical protein